MKDKYSGLSTEEQLKRYKKENKKVVKTKQKRLKMAKNAQKKEKNLYFSYGKREKMN